MVVLVSMPWAHYHMPSIQLGVLQSYLRQHEEAVETKHWFVEIAHALGFEGYNMLWYPFLENGEALYSYLLFPEKRKAIRGSSRLKRQIERVNQYYAEKELVPKLPVELTDDFFERFDSINQDLFDKVDWDGVPLVGFTLNFGQTVASLYAAMNIKRRAPDCKVLFGGAEASGMLGASILEHFDQVDFACNGEGEQPLLNLVRAFRSNAPADVIAEIPGLIVRGESGIRINPPDQVPAMNALPTPTYDDYFSAVQEFDNVAVHEVCSYLPIEASRGCYYSCSFCALNVQWENSRCQDPKSVVMQMDALSARYEMLEFFFTDNITPPNATPLFESIKEAGKDYRFFYEIRANLSRETLALMKAAGARRVQIGIEALSTSLLMRYNKKSSTIMNLQAMKNCFELRIPVSANLIIEHPSSEQSDADESVANIAFAAGFPPPDSICPFALEVGAPDFENTEAREYVYLGNYHLYRDVYPKRLFKSLHLPRKDFRSIKPPVDWAPFDQAYAQWSQTFRENEIILGEFEPHLGYYDGRDFLRIEDRRNGDHNVVILNKIERAVYLAASQTIHLNRLSEKTGLGKAVIEAIVDEFVSARLMFREKDWFLSLASPVRR